MAKIEWNADGLRRAVEQAAQGKIDQWSAGFQQRVQALTCPTHGAHPQVTVTGNRIAANGFCCEEFRDTVTAYMKSITDESRKAA